MPAQLDDSEKQTNRTMADETDESTSEAGQLQPEVMPHVGYNGYKYASDAVRERYPNAELVWESTIEGRDFCIVKDGDGNELSYGSRSPQKEWEAAWAAHCKS